MSEMKNLKQEILTGSARLVAGNKHPFDRVKYMSDYMYLNKAFTFQLAKSKISEKNYYKILRKNIKIIEISGQIFLRYMRIKKILMIHLIYIRHFQ